MFSFTCIFFFYFNSDLSKFYELKFPGWFWPRRSIFPCFILLIYENGVKIIIFALRGTERYSHYGASTWEILNERGHKEQNNLEAGSHQC